MHVSVLYNVTEAFTMQYEHWIHRRFVICADINALMKENNKSIMEWFDADRHLPNSFILPISQQFIICLGL